MLDFNLDSTCMTCLTSLCVHAAVLGDQITQLCSPARLGRVKALRTSVATLKNADEDKQWLSSSSTSPQLRGQLAMVRSATVFASPVTAKRKIRTISPLACDSTVATLWGTVRSSSMRMNQWYAMAPPCRSNTCMAQLCLAV